MQTPPASFPETVSALADLYWLVKWYRDEYPDAEPPARLVKFSGPSDTMGRAFRIIADSDAT